MRYLDPSIDYVFKLLFKDPSDERRLVAMLNAILDPPVPIVSAKVENPQIPGDITTAKQIVLDVFATLSDGTTVDVELEAWPRPVFVRRLVFYWARAHSKQLDVGEDYGTLRPTISIAWLADPRDGSRSFVGSPRVHSKYRIRETTTNAELTDHLEIHLLDLRNLANDATLSSPLRRWAEFFDHPTEETLRRLANEDEIMADTIKKLEEVSTDKQAYFLAEARKKAQLWERVMPIMEREDGFAEGRAEGRAAGLAEGIAKARAASLVELLEVKFGGILDSHEKRIAEASEVDFKRWTRRVLTASTVDEVFGE